MKTARKEFLVSSNYLECIRANGSGYLELASDKCIHKISITYQVPEKKIEINESEFDLAVACADREYSGRYGGALSYVDILKDQLFKDK